MLSFLIGYVILVGLADLDWVFGLRMVQVALVASLIDLKAGWEPGEVHVSKDCRKDPSFVGCGASRDGWLLLNTAVVLEDDGRLVQKPPGHVAGGS